MVDLALLFRATKGDALCGRVYAGKTSGSTATARRGGGGGKLSTECRRYGRGKRVDSRASRACTSLFFATLQSSVFFSHEAANSFLSPVSVVYPWGLFCSICASLEWQSI